jgi:hypothetical protein
VSFLLCYNKGNVVVGYVAFKTKKRGLYLPSNSKLALHGRSRECFGECIACCCNISYRFPSVTLTRLTLRGIKHDKNIVMLARILNFVETNKSSFGACPACHPTLGLLDLALAASFIYRQRELCVNQLQSKLSTLIRLLESVGEAELEVHGISMREVFEEGEKLDDVVLFDDLQTDAVGGPLLVDGHYHTTAGYGEGVCETR